MTDLLGEPVAGEALRLDDSPGGHGLLLDAALLLRVDLGAPDHLRLDLAPAHLFKERSGLPGCHLSGSKYPKEFVLKAQIENNFRTVLIGH